MATGKIAHAFAQAIPRSECGELRAVGSRNDSSAREFASQYHIPNVNGGYRNSSKTPRRPLPAAGRRRFYVRLTNSNDYRDEQLIHSHAIIPPSRLQFEILGSHGLPRSAIRHAAFGARNHLRGMQYAEADS